MKHRICTFSGGHSSAIAAIEVVRKYSKNDVVLLNHNINPNVENADIKRFKQEVADYLGLPITYANVLGITEPEKLPDQFDVTMIAKAFRVGDGSELCTNRLKTAPWMNWLAANTIPSNSIVYYSFDSTEQNRIIRRRKILEIQGYKSEYPLAKWESTERTIKSITEIGIKPPLTYAQYKHANCVGCLKAGKQHWYIVYCTRSDIWEKAKKAEAYIKHTIHPDESLESLEPLFDAMRIAGIPATEHVNQQKFWADVKKVVSDFRIQPDLFSKPCECVV